jgi:hypothetical protein
VSVDRTRKRKKDSFSLGYSATADTIQKKLKEKPLTGPAHLSQRCSFWQLYTPKKLLDTVYYYTYSRARRKSMMFEGIWRKLVISPSPIGIWAKMNEWIHHHAGGKRWEEKKKQSVISARTRSTVFGVSLHSSSWETFLSSNLMCVGAVVTVF